MTYVESIILSAAVQGKVRNRAQLSKRTAIPLSTLCDKMAHPGKIRLDDLAAMDAVCHFTPEQALQIIRNCKK